MKRWKPSRKRSKKIFTATADHIKKINVAPAPMRGGIRM